MKSLNWRVRNVQLKETVPQHIIDEALARIEVILFEWRSCHPVAGKRLVGA